MSTTAEQEKTRSGNALFTYEFPFPLLDERIHYVGASRMREFTSDELRALNASEDLYVIQNGGVPISVLLGYDLFMRILKIANSAPTREATASQRAEEQWQKSQF